MPVRRFNYTGRRKISQEHIDIWLDHKDEDSIPIFNANLDKLKQYNFPDNSYVFIEAYRRSSWMRFRFGTIGNVYPKADRMLTDFNSSEGLNFRLKVVSFHENKRKILGIAEKLKPRVLNDDNQRRNPLLSVKPDDNLHEIYRIEFHDEPILLVNRKIGDWNSFTKSPIFISLALPEVLRTILTKIVIIDEFNEINDENDWRSKWLQFVNKSLKIQELPKENYDTEKEFWINNVVSVFSRKNKVINKLIENIQE